MGTRLGRGGRCGGAGLVAGAGRQGGRAAPAPHRHARHQGQGGAEGAAALEADAATLAAGELEAP